MLNSDLLLQRKIEPAMCTPDQVFGPVAAPPVQSDDATVQEVDFPSFQEYLQTRETNLIVPNPTPTEEPAEEEPEPFWDTSLDGPSAENSLEDGGVSVESRRGVREYLESGYTRTNPDGTYEVDSDMGGKFASEVTVVEGTAEHVFFEATAAEGAFGEEGDFFQGEGKALTADSSMEGSFEVTTTSANLAGEIQASGSFLEGEVSTDDTGLVSAEADGSVVSGEAKLAGEATFSAEEATLSGEVGAEVNLIEGSIGGDIHITPRRIINPGIQLWNWATNDDVGELGENWDVGLMIGGEVSGQVGAQIGAEGEVGYSDGRATAEAGVKVGLGLGVGVKARGGLVGLDTLWDNIWN
jgi:hypothetical protein